MVPVRLTGPRLAIREFHHTPGDVDALHAVFGDPEAIRYLPFEPRDREDCADQIEQYLEEALRDERTVYRLAVTRHTDAGDPADATPIGTAALTLGGHRSALLGYALRADTWGNGYAGEITSLLCDFAFGPLGLHRLAARVDVDHDASARVLTRAGFHLEGRVRHDVYLRGAWHDSFQYSLLQDEWPPGRGDNPTPAPAGSRMSGRPLP
ncbi:GNAT family N-acetyltransferase [Kitasatospora sp. RG8]|uniref:GNAT family N-acetyltransferase n=1 Tax=Kitasatospora sp. RG8 TaxID=2820815 RepID=UPI001AE09D6B|nr:GNAT family protein [Kitasatospora sp. RG8]MBP0451860.1 GNAT family N-acetyltransferase [Kitasatospora sp. RG8]